MILIKKFENSKLFINYKEFLENFVLYFAMFPYVSFGILPYDSQPYAFIAAILYFTFYRKVFDRNLLLLWVVFLVLWVILTISQISNLDFTLSVRALISYSIFFLVWIVSYHIHLYRNPLKHYLIGTWIYISYGFLQSIGFKFLDWMSAHRTTGNRGVNSFTAEPTYFGIILFFLAWILYLSFQKYKTVPGEKNKIFIFFVYFTLFAQISSIFLLAKSAMVILWLFLVATYSIIFLLNIRLIFSIIITVLLVYLYIILNFETVETTRAWQLFYNLWMVGLVEIVYMDWSVNGRVASIIFPFWGIFENGGLPGGFQTFGDLSSKLIIETNYYFWAATTNHKVWSFIGAFAYEFGIIGIFFLYSIMHIAVIDYNWKVREIILLFILLISCVPLGIGLVPLLIGSKITGRKN